jgi:eukaryotic-like serine/threonine-protein kinase
MSTAPTTFSVTPVSETPKDGQLFREINRLAGYLIRERLGAGGYGEVWKADVPGGLCKAVKIVYGCRDDERAAKELAALNRIKQVRHPFLLSLERIERIEGHLVIVTELATSSLKQEFDKCRTAGMAGIPRNELIAHLHDAADALDYISQQYSLQHLDVKPENLLLVGGRIKVADFGLVKDLEDVNSSIVGGMTPIYAAPELFDGRPSIHSDQYSLAIVYQEMLTGVLPYEGRTTAQLASQHLHGRPRLDRLPASDEPTIARALAKDPERRFSSCLEMIEALLDATPNARARAPRAVKRPTTTNGYPASGHAAGGHAASPAESPRADTEIVSREEISAAHEAAGGPAAAHRTQLTETPLAVRDLPPLNLEPAEIGYRPTIFLGVGGLATRTLHTLHQRIESRFGDPAALPAIQFLLFETDADSLKMATDTGQAPLKNDAAVLLPLRQSADYRNDLSGRFNWLSRRWIYNIPRSGQTQGLRPLGRLALVDKMEYVIEQVTRVIRAAVDPAGIAATAAATGLPFRDSQAGTPAPRVFIVSSTTGGTGSGAVLDIGYVARQVLRDLELPDDAICGVLAHCTGRNSPTREFATANAYSLLSELNHYSDLQHIFPGDPAAGLDSFGGDDAPFNHAYLVHLGEDLEADGFTSAVDTLAKYLYHGTLTTAATFFDKCRALETAGKPAAKSAPTLRTFGLCQLGFSSDDVPSGADDDLCRSVLVRWCGKELNRPDPAAATLSDPTSLLATHFAQGVSAEDLRAKVVARASAASITLECVIGRFRSALAIQMGNDRKSYLLTALGEILNNSTPQRSLAAQVPPSNVILEALDSMIRYQGTQESHRLCLESALESPLQEISAAAGAELGEWLLGLLNSPEHRLAGAQAVTDALAEHLRELSRQAGDAINAAANQLRSLKETLLADKHGSKNWLRYQGLFSKQLTADRRLSDYFELRLQELELNSFCRLVGVVLAQVARVGDKLRNLAVDFNRLIEEFSTPPPPADESTDRAKTLQRIATARIFARKAELLTRMEHGLEEHLRQAVTAEAGNARGKLAIEVRRTSRTLILEMLKEYAAEETTAALEGRPHEPLFAVSAGLAAALPQRLTACGGQRRLLITAPENLISALSGTRYSGSSATVDGKTIVPTVLPDAGGDVLICYEVEDQPMRRIAGKVLDKRYQAVDVAARLHTRSDVPWAPM